MFVDILHGQNNRARLAELNQTLVAMDYPSVDLDLLHSMAFGLQVGLEPEQLHHEGVTLPVEYFSAIKSMVGIE